MKLNEGQLLERIQQYLRRQGVRHYPLSRDGTYKIIGGEPEHMGDYFSPEPKRSEQVVQGRYIDVVGYAVQQADFYWGGDSKRDDVSSDRAGFIEQVAEPKRIEKDHTLDTLL